MKLIKDTYVSWNAEVIFITSNWQGNKEMMEGCKEAGIPAFVSCLIFSADVSECVTINNVGNSLGFLKQSAWITLMITRPVFGGNRARVLE